MLFIVNELAYSGLCRSRELLVTRRASVPLKEDVHNTSNEMQRVLKKHGENI
jgi:hypothetical protein